MTYGVGPKDGEEESAGQLSVELVDKNVANKSAFFFEVAVVGIRGNF